MNELQYRANFFIQLLQSAVAVVTALVVLALVYSHTDELNGWSESELMVVMGIQILLGGVIRTTIQPNMERLMEEVRDGKLDFALTKPEDSQVLVSVREVRIWRSVDVVSRRDRARVRHLGARARGRRRRRAAVRRDARVGALMIYCFWLAIATLAFWIVNVWNIIELFDGVYQTGRWPVSIYPGWLRIGVTFLVPIAFAITVPAEAVTSRLEWSTVALALVFAAVLFARAGSGTSGSAVTRARPRRARAVQCLAGAWHCAWHWDERESARVAVLKGRPTWPFRRARVVHAELLAEHPADLADRGLRAERLAHRREEVLGAARDAHLGERARVRIGVALGPHARGPLELPPLGLRVEPVELDRLGVLLDVAVHADEHALAALDLLLVAKGGLLDLGLDEALLDRRDRAAELVDAPDQLRARCSSSSVSASMKYAPPSGSAVSVLPASCARSCCVRSAIRRRALRRQRERLVEAVRVDRLRAAADRRERLDRDPHDVVLRLLRRERRPARLRVEAKRERARFVAPNRSRMISRPQPPRRAELRHLLEEVVVRVEEEGEPRAELVRRQAGVDRRLRIRDPVRERERELLHCGRAASRMW